MNALSLSYALSLSLDILIVDVWRKRFELGKSCSAAVSKPYTLNHILSLFFSSFPTEKLTKRRRISSNNTGAEDATLN